MGYTLNAEMIEKVIANLVRGGWKVDVEMARRLGSYLAEQKVEHPDATTAAQWYKGYLWNSGYMS